MRYVALVCSLIFVGEAFGQHYELERKIENPKGQQNGRSDNFGYWIGAVEDKLIVGAYDEDTGAPDAGSAYLFDADGQLLTTFHNPDPVQSGAFGWGVAGVGGRVLIGARHNEGGGKAYLFEQDGTLVKTIDNPTGASGDDFSHSPTAVGEGRFLLNAPHARSGKGAAYLYDADGALLKTIVNESPASTSTLGRLSLFDGERILIAAGDASSNGGSVNIYDRAGELLGTVGNPGTNTNGFGVGLATVGQTTLVGGFYDQKGDVGGQVFMFDRQGKYESELLNPSPGADDWFGMGLLATSASTFLVSSVFESTNAVETGAVYHYDLSGNLLQTILNPDPDGGEHFGLDMEVIGDRLYISSQFEGAGRAGAVYVYRMTPEPHSLVLGLLGVVLVVVWRRRREGDRRSRPSKCVSPRQA